MSGLVLHAPAPASVRLIECSPPSWMVELCMREKQLDYAVDVLDFAKGEHRSPAMLARNPRGTVPVLSDGDGRAPGPRAGELSRPRRIRPAHACAPQRPGDLAGAVAGRPLSLAHGIIMSSVEV